MTREEAISLLQSKIDLIDKCYLAAKDYKEALEMAVKALEQQKMKKEKPCEDVPDIHVEKRGMTNDCKRIV